MTTPIKTLIDFVSRLKSYRDIAEKCNDFLRKYKQALSDANEERQTVICSGIKNILKIIYDANKASILEKDFSFIKKGMFIVDDTDIGHLYIEAIDNNDDTDQIRKINSGLLFLFYQVMDEEDRKNVEAKFSGSKKAKETPKSENHDIIPNMSTQIDALISKNADVIKQAEKDPSKVGDVVESIFKNNSGELSNMIKGLVGSMGLNGKNQNINQKQIMKNVKKVIGKKSD